jgi:hypothetical protein
MLSKAFDHDGMTNYDAASQRRFTKKHIRYIVALLPWMGTVVSHLSPAGGGGTRLQARSPKLQLASGIVDRFVLEGVTDN